MIVVVYYKFPILIVVIIVLLFLRNIVVTERYKKTKHWVWRKDHDGAPVKQEPHGQVPRVWTFPIQSQGNAIIVMLDKLNGAVEEESDHQEDGKERYFEERTRWRTCVYKDLYVNEGDDYSDKWDSESWEMLQSLYNMHLVHVELRLKLKIKSYYIT